MKKQMPEIEKPGVLTVFCEGLVVP